MEEMAQVGRVATSVHNKELMVQVGSERRQDGGVDLNNIVFAHCQVSGLVLPIPLPAQAWHECWPSPPSVGVQSPVGISRQRLIVDPSVPDVVFCRGTD